MTLFHLIRTFKYRSLLIDITRFEIGVFHTGCQFFARWLRVSKISFPDFISYQWFELNPGIPSRNQIETIFLTIHENPKFFGSW